MTTPGSEYPGRGVAILGDSAGAHFAIPNNWMRPTKFNSTTFENLLMILTRILKTFLPQFYCPEVRNFSREFFFLTNELDWPMLSWATGMSENCWYEDIHAYGDIQVDSIYQRMVEWNRCALKLDTKYNENYYFFTQRASVA